MTTAIVDGQIVKVGDSVCFKSDYEQCGQIIEIKNSSWNGKILVLENKSGFGGEYLQYATITEEPASDCWL